MFKDRDPYCPEHGIGIEAQSPAKIASKIADGKEGMFSFNSPFGACESCYGLGIKMKFDPDLIISDKGKSIEDGALTVYRNAVGGWRGQR